MEEAVITVDIVAATEWDYMDAAALLIFTKSTRLNMSRLGLVGIRQKVREDWPWALEELSYMAKTIRSSWEFLDITFAIGGVSRACAQQMTRTRQASYAMQSQRVLDIREQPMHVPAAIKADPDLLEVYKDAHAGFVKWYSILINNGVSTEDARGIAPINLSCNLVGKYNFRTITDLIPARTSYRAQGEYRDIAAAMKAKVIGMWPWAELFFAPRNETAVAILDELAAYVDQDDARVHDIKLLIAKAKDTIEGGK